MSPDDFNWEPLCRINPPALVASCVYLRLQQDPVHNLQFSSSKGSLFGFVHRNGDFWDSPPINLLQTDYAPFQKWVAVRGKVALAFRGVKVGTTERPLFGSLISVFFFSIFFKAHGALNRIV
jgi:hypothetical protein